jgi:hypothetical protein
VDHLSRRIEEAVAALETQPDTDRDVREAAARV